MDAWSLETGLKVLILDDLAQNASECIDIVNLFTVYSHHNIFFCCILYICKNKFGVLTCSNSLHNHIILLLFILKVYLIQK